jgi:hypothetical protein
MVTVRRAVKRVRWTQIKSERYNDSIHDAQVSDPAETEPCPQKHLKARIPTMAEFYPGVSKIQYEGSKSKNPLATVYNPDEVIAAKK